MDIKQRSIEEAGNEVKASKLDTYKRKGKK
jgi:hypothetical protein